MKLSWFLLGTAVFLLFGMTACGAQSGSEETETAPEGPALIMFYTDN